jgi:ABC-2 type transport system ATP-binding protein
MFRNLIKNQRKNLYHSDVAPENAGATSEDAIVFDSVSKIYRIYHDTNPSLKETLIHLRRSTFEEFLALDKVSFSVGRGETFGIIGPNGSGKSTILKLLARIIRPESGNIAINGSVSALLELGAGFHPDLTGKENIYLNASILGVDRKSIDQKFQEIVDFAELDRFIDTPVKNYSSGMYVRLGFAIAINVNPDILLIDEVLAVGDQSFQSKCLGAIFDFIRQGKTIIIVSHDLDMVRNLCSRALFICQGRVLEYGRADDVVRGYRSYIERTEREKSIVQAAAANEEIPQTGERFGSGEALIERVCLLDSCGREVNAIHAGEDATISLRVVFREQSERPIFGIRITDERDINVYGTNTWIQGVKTRIFRKGESVEVNFSQKMDLIKGNYRVTAAVSHNDGRRYYDWRTNVLKLAVFDESYAEGIANLNSEIRIKKAK